jgi:pyridoxine/pyridoxamine 5'-phosphate oxidase
VDFEFWISGDDSLHDLFLFTREGERCEQVRLSVSGLC